MEDVAPELRLQLLRENCDSSEQTKYYKDLSSEELDIIQERLVQNLIKLDEWEKELTAIKDEYKEKMKPFVNDNRLALEQAATRKALITGTIFHMADHDARVMETFDENGYFVGSRRLRPDEIQAKLFPVTKVADHPNF